MPELPEVETVCRGLQTALAGQRLAGVDLRRAGLRFPFPAKLSARVSGGRVCRVYRRAKYALVELDNGRTMILHLGMSGRLLVIPPPGKPAQKYAPQQHDHVVFRFHGGGIVVFNDPRRFGMLDIAKTEDLQTHRFFRHLGPEPFDKKLTPARFAASLCGRAAPVKLAIMDQRLIVGVGNIYASEALFDAGIHPARAAGSLSAAECRRLLAAIRKVLTRAIKAGGSSLRDYVQTDGALGYFQHQWAVYGKTGEKCAGCSCRLQKTGGIAKIVQGGRATFFCPTKQKQDTRR